MIGGGEVCESSNKNMPRRRLREFYRREAVEFWSHVVEERPLLPFLIPLVILAWALERWIVHFSNWVPLAVAVWAMIQVCLSWKMVL